MTEREKMLAGKIYDAGDRELREMRLAARELTYEINHCRPTERVKIRALFARLVGSSGEGIGLEPPFHCDYGENIHIGKNFFANFNCIMLDCATITIGDNVFMGPNVGLYCAGHPLDAAWRNEGVEFALPITIGDNVWIGGTVSILQGVTIGANTVIASGSVVNKDIPSGVVAAGNPCRVIRKINENDKVYYAKCLRED